MPKAAPKPDADVITQLNAVLQSKLTGINQHFLHARILKNQGNVAQADLEYKISIDAMKHADMLVEHILGMGGMPNLQDLGKISIGHSVPEIFTNDLRLLEMSCLRLDHAITICQMREDFATAGLLGTLRENQQERIDLIRQQINLETMKECA